MNDTATAPLSVEERKTVLDERIHNLIADGYAVKYAADTSATLVIPGRDFRILLNWFMGMITFGIWLLIWAVLIFINPAGVLMKPIFIEVTETGVVRATTRGLFGKTVEDHAHSQGEQ